MLRKFEVSGFKNFRDKLVLDLSDVRDYRFNAECIANGLLNKVIIYGKNAIGKSNFGLALFDIVTHLSGKNVTPGLYDFYLNVENTRGYAEFLYVFQFDASTVEYSYKKDDNQVLLSERIVLDQKVLLDYDYKTKSGDSQGLRALAPTLNWVFQEDDSILRYVMNNTVLDEMHPLRQMMHYVSNMLWFRSLDENRYIGYKTKSTDYFDFVFEEGMLQEFETFLKKAGINDKLTVKKDPSGKKVLYFDLPRPLPFFKVASNGTKALYTFFYWYKTSAKVSLMFIDEFDAFYHYELAETIVEMLEKSQGYQTILTSHNTNLLTNRIMRPDCYFILSEHGLSSLANATKRELREGHNLEKLYISGEFDG